MAAFGRPPIGHAARPPRDANQGATATKHNQSSDQIL